MPGFRSVALILLALVPVSAMAQKTEDKVIGALKLGIPAEKVKITPVEEVFAR